MNNYQVVLADDTETFTITLESDSDYVIDDYDSGKVKMRIFSRCVTLSQDTE